MWRFLFAVALVACTTHGEPTGATCPDHENPPVTWANFGESFMTTYCTSCHTSALPLMKDRNGAPVYHDFDMLETTAGPIEHIDEQAGAGPNAVNTLMPPKRCPTTPGGLLDKDCAQPTLMERQQLAVWMACLKDRRAARLDPL